MTLQKQKKQIQSEIEIIKSKEDLLKNVLVAYAASDNFNFTQGMDMYDEKKVESKVKREELEDELADVEKKIREVGPSPVTYSEHQVTGSTFSFQDFLTCLETVKVNLEAETACEVSLTITTSRHPKSFHINNSHGIRHIYSPLYATSSEFWHRLLPQNSLPCTNLKYIRRGLERCFPRNLNCSGL